MPTDPDNFFSAIASLGSLIGIDILKMSSMIYNIDFPKKA